MWWIWPVYVLLLVAVTFLSVLLARYVDALNKKTNLSEGVLGGILLAGVTSLPELITSLSAVLLIKQPALTFGNIIGSNFFDIIILGILMMTMFNLIKNKKVGKNTGYFIWLSFALSVIVLLFNIFNIQVEIPGINFNMLSVIILLFYICVILISRKSKPEENLEEADVKIGPKLSKMSTKQIVWWFVLVSLGLVAVSVGLTYATEYISTNYEIGKGIAGALFLGVATSLPELISCIELVRLGNFDMAINNIFGSCMFNYLILALVDIFYFSGSVFTFGLQSIYFISFMLFVNVVFAIIYHLMRKRAKVTASPWLYAVTGFVMTASYVVCMVLSANLT